MEQQEQAATNHHTTSTAQSPGDADYANGQGADQRSDRELMEQFLANPAHDYRNLQYGDTVDGIIMRVSRWCRRRRCNRSPKKIARR
jgi:small subunit ribosomal protein S1